jgi:octaprenyl-diphosphate synthase
LAQIEQLHSRDGQRMTQADIRALLKSDLAGVDQIIRVRLKSVVPLVDQVAEHIIGGGGKRLRPMLVLLSGRAVTSPADSNPRRRWNDATATAVSEAAAFIEFIHTATLLHDDVVDGSSKRRGRDTANHVFGNQASVLVGDFVYSRAFQMMAAIGVQRVMEIMADATNTIAEGEVLQLMNARDPSTTEQRYFEVIYRKTAKLFEAGAEVAAVLAGGSAAEQAALASYGKHLGNAYQLIDDVLDYQSNPTERGKNLGDDLAEGKPTLPLIHALKKGSDAQRALIRQAIEHGGLDRLEDIVHAIESTGGLDYTANAAQSESRMAIDAIAGLPESAHKQGLIALARIAVSRTS